MIRLFLIIILFILSGLNETLQAQDKWELKEEKNGIKVYVKEEKNSTVLSYQIITNISKSLEEVYQQIIDFHENKKYLEKIKYLRILEHNPQKRLIVYMVYGMPWPFSDRDLVIDMKINIQKDVITIRSKPANHRVEKKENTVRLKDFYEIWKLEMLSDDSTRLFLQGHADPQVNFPGWIVNLYVVKEPYSLIHGIKTESEKQSR